VLNLIKATEWNEPIRYVESRLARLSRIGNCPVIYVGSTEAKEGGLGSRLKDLAGRRHTALLPVLVFLAARWRMDSGFITCSTAEDAWELGDAGILPVAEGLKLKSTVWCTCCARPQEMDFCYISE